MKEDTNNNELENAEQQEKKKLTQWKNEPTLKKLKEDYTSASSSHSNQISKINTWLDYYYVEGSAKLNIPKGKSQVQPALIRKQAEWRFAALSEPFLSTSDLFDVSPVSHEDRKAANQNALILNNQFQTKINKVKFIDEFIRAAVTEGTAIVKLGWVLEEKEVTEYEPVFTYQQFPPEALEQVQQQLDSLLQIKAQEPDTYSQVDPATREMVRVFEETQQLIYPQIAGEKEVKKIKTVKNHPEVTICDYKSIIVDPTCEGDFSKANFVIHTFTTSLSELKEAGIYSNLDIINSNVTEGTGNGFNNTNGIYAMPDDQFRDGIDAFTFQDKPRKKLTVYEYWGYWDIDGTGIVKPIVASWVGNVLIRLEENPYPDGELPFVIIPYLPVKNSVYGEPDGSLLQDHQKIIGAVTRGMIDLLGKSANSQTGFPKQLLDSVNRKRFMNGENYEYNPMGMAPQSAIYQHTYPEIPNSALNMIQLMNTEAEAFTGVKSFSTGGGITGANLGDTAAGVRGALDAASKREMGILRRLSNGIIQIGRKIIAMNAIFLEEEEIVRITNDKFIAIRKDDLAGNFDLKLTISTAEADNAKAQELAFMLQTMGNTLDFSMSKIILSEIAKLRQMPDLAKTIDAYEPQPSPEEQQIQQLQIAKLQAEIELLQAQAKEAATKGDIHTAKISVEQARAENLQNEADNKALDFIHKQDGTDIQKDLMKEQLKGDNNLKIAERTKDLDNLGKLMNTSQQGINNLVTQGNNING